MRQLVLTPKFKRAFRKFAKSDRVLQKRIEETLKQLEQDAFAASLETHKLSGQLKGLQACSCGYDCRIIFAIEQEKTTQSEVIILLDIGSHDDVY